MVGEPSVSVVVATRDRAERLAQLLASLRAQTLDPAGFEVIVVDDGSTDTTPAVLRAAAAENGLRLRSIRRPDSRGPAAARNAGWRAARAPLVAFTDDDCVATPAWLEEGLAAARAAAVVQGRVDPNPAQLHLLGPFSRTLEVHSAGPEFHTCNIFYRRELLEGLGGFDESFPLPGGEDTDLGWRARASGATIAYAPAAHVLHEVARLGPLPMLRFARRWEHAIPVFAKHPELRREQLHLGLFWSAPHAHLLRFLAALPLLRRQPTLAALLARPYARRLVARRSRGLLAPWLLLHDLVELWAVLRGAVRNRVAVL
jgi:glycosyltransferase involved in cell wall biosynthesis